MFLVQAMATYWHQTHERNHVINNMLWYQTPIPSRPHYIQHLTFMYIFIFRLVNTYYLGSQLYWTYELSLEHPDINAALFNFHLLSLKPGGYCWIDKK